MNSIKILFVFFYFLLSLISVHSQVNLFFKLNIICYETLKSKTSFLCLRETPLALLKFQLINNSFIKLDSSKWDNILSVSTRQFFVCLQTPITTHRYTYTYTTVNLKTVYTGCPYVRQYHSFFFLSKIFKSDFYKLLQK